nr:RIP metalloprotease RseP [Ardenticatena sp.]
MLITIVSFAVVLGLLVLVHEIGHFVAAKAAGIKVLEFGIGYPPRALTLFKHGETEYTLNWLPLGGFVRMLGEEDPSHPDSFAAKPPLARALVLLAGPFMNFVLAVALFALLAMVAGVPTEKPANAVTILAVTSGSPAEEAGLQEGDVILYVANQRVTTSEQLQALTQEFRGKPLTLVVRRGDREFEVTLVPREQPPAGEGPIGIQITDRLIERYGPIEAFRAGFVATKRASLLILNGLRGMLSGEVGREAVAGPVGIAQVTGEVAREGGLLALINFTAVLSINLAILNLLPLPALDGGRLMFVLLEVVRGGKRISPEKEGLVHFVGMAILLGLVLIVTYFDVLRLFSNESLMR